ncbi:plasmid mobilization protein [Vibrio alginolyticus]|uniref:plasmid mobilization protein n=1 Tax=Vibrio alginolyticus TaxID=663 RepID=UPI00072216C4|nr:plasmid mobilization relaxosome protein MobC [Vibrio alginolyticus]EHJ9985280.1 plasmid mobilization relaxosome protein MobC [Vibrio parahaemolyticus]ALR95867.1 relaxosome protein [Vibrio alginolyticus]EHK6028007.1 plasmid mobilization relaxosome protein MobC [Vibrio parahaemolyticus]EIA1590149.1 plasmid mobilization relaxosome protein MobC [Vibrio parahaemolyticus]EJE8676001.1 plasmid mobilization relaxosome protein MobC [Vibrio parahaemolyticus]
MTKKENRNVPISFRLTESEYAPFKLILETTELTRTEFFRRVFLNNEYHFDVKERPPKELDRLLFLFNKSSNNLNQVAHKLNSAYRGGVISEKVYLETLNNIVSIERLLRGALDKC